MKILVIQDFLRSGGTERQSILLANSFAAADHPTTLLTFRPGGALDSTLSPQVGRCALQPFDLRIDWFAPRLRSNVRRYTPDIILCMGRMANCYAGTLQVAFPDTAVVATLRTGKKLPLPYVRSLRMVRHIVANSHEAQDTLIRQHVIPAEKTAAIHNSLVFPAPVDCATSDGARKSLRSQHGATDATTILLCVAMFRPEKNQRGLIETLGTLPAGLDWQLWLAGDGPARAGCEQLVSAKQLGDRIKFLGFLPDPAAVYLAADVAVHASASEALSNFIIEAQAHGLPAVVYAAQGMVECFRPRTTGWVIPRGDRAAFNASIVRLARETKSARATRAAAARAYARENFHPQRQVAAYLELFQDLLRRSAP